jgi:hypothetical protein
MTKLYLVLAPLRVTSRRKDQDYVYSTYIP